MSTIFRNNRNLIKRNIRILLLFEVIYKIFFIFFMLPLLNYGIKYVMGLWGQSYLTAQNLISFLRFPPTILLFIIVIIVVSIFILIETTSIINFYHAEMDHKKPRMTRILIWGFVKALRCVFTGNILLPFFALLMFIIANLPLIIGILYRIRIPNYLLNVAFNEDIIKAFLLICLILLFSITFRGIFILQFCINERQSFKEGKNSSKKLLKGRIIRTTVLFFLHNLFMALCFLIFYFGVLLIAALVIFVFVDQTMVIVVFLSIYSKINLAVGIIISMFGLITNLNFICSMYQEYRLEDNKKNASVPIKLQEEQFQLPSVLYKNILIVVFVLFIAFGATNIYQTIRNDSFSLENSLDGIQIASHRGSSANAPENTMPAIQSAIVEMADYVEIDIQQTKDGIIVLLHDSNLKRTTGINKKIWQLTYEEVNLLDAGLWFGDEFTNTKIPTLEEVLIYCKGKIKLNIDIKKNGHEQELEEQLVALIEKYDYENQCIISSVSYNTLVKIKTLNDTIKTGYILSAAYGNFYNKEFVDFFSIKYNFVNKTVVDSAHNVGKEVHVWTVNSTNEFERLKAIGVDTIITDNPIHAREILYSADASQTFIELLNRMLKAKQ